MNIEWLETAAKILAGWTTLSVLFAIGWSRFMYRLKCKEHAVPSARPAAGSAHQIAA